MYCAMPFCLEVNKKLFEAPFEKTVHCHIVFEMVGTDRMHRGKRTSGLHTGAKRQETFGDFDRSIFIQEMSRIKCVGMWPIFGISMDCVGVCYYWCSRRKFKPIHHRSFEIHACQTQWSDRSQPLDLQRDSVCVFQQNWKVNYVTSMSIILITRLIRRLSWRTVQKQPWYTASMFSSKDSILWHRRMRSVSDPVRANVMVSVYSEIPTAEPYPTKCANQTEQTTDQFLGLKTSFQ